MEPSTSFADALSFDPSFKIKKKPGKPSKLLKLAKQKSKIGKTPKGVKNKTTKTKGRGKGKGPGRTPKFQALAKYDRIQDDPATGTPVLQTVKKRKEDMPFDLEQQFILRLPPGPAIALRRDVESGSVNLKDRLLIEIEPDMRHCKVTYGGQVMNAKLMDLPTIIQTMKTTDRKNFYCSADISQLLVCVSDDEENKDESESKKKERDNKWKWNHGIAPPLKNVRKRRFRKTTKKKFNDQPDIEKEVKRLFRMDAEAIDVKWEVVVEDTATEGSAEILAAGTTGTQDATTNKAIDPRYLEFGEDEIFGEVSSSDDDMDDDKDVNIVDSEEEMVGNAISDADNSVQQGDFSQMGDSNQMSDSGEVNLQMKLREIEKQIEDTREKRINVEMEMEGVDNYLLKERLQRELDALVEDETRKEQEYQILAAMLTQV